MLRKLTAMKVRTVATRRFRRLLILAIELGQECFTSRYESVAKVNC